MPPLSDEMADYAITAVRYDACRSICKLRVHEVRPGSVGPPLEISREQLVVAIKLGRRFVAIRADRSGRYSAPTHVRLMELDGRIYLRGDPHAWSCDELDGIQDF
jgi:hypothetical protein